MNNRVKLRRKPVGSVMDHAGVQAAIAQARTEGYEEGKRAKLKAKDAATKAVRRPGYESIIEPGEVVSDHSQPYNQRRNLQYITRYDFQVEMDYDIRTMEYRIASRLRRPTVGVAEVVDMCDYEYTCALRSEELHDVRPEGVADLFVVRVIVPTIEGMSMYIAEVDAARHLCLALPELFDSVVGYSSPVTYQELMHCTATVRGWDRHAIRI